MATSTKPSNVQGFAVVVVMCLHLRIGRATTRARARAGNPTALDCPANSVSSSILLAAALPAAKWMLCILSSLCRPERLWLPRGPIAVGRQLALLAVILEPIRVRAVSIEIRDRLGCFAARARLHDAICSLLFDSWITFVSSKIKYTGTLSTLETVSASSRSTDASPFATRDIVASVIPTWSASHFWRRPWERITDDSAVAR